MKQQTLFEIYDEEHPSRKVCNKCGQEKGISEFHKNEGAKDGFHPHCKTCKKKYREEHKKESKEYREIHHEEHRKYNKEYREIHKLQARNAVLKCKFNINESIRRQIHKYQNGCCAICGIDQSKLKRKLAVDHDHITGKVRGLLCGNCNTSLGKFKDNLQILQKATDYLNKHKV